MRTRNIVFILLILLLVAAVGIVSFAAPADLGRFFEQGKLRVVAKGVRKIRSRKAGHLEPFTRVSLLLAAGRDLPIVTQAEAQETHTALREDLLRMGYAAYVIELLDRFTFEEGENSALFRLLIETLKRLSQEAELGFAVRYYEIRLLDLVGFRPQLFNCAHCEEQIKPQDQYFSASTGGVAPRPAACSQPTRATSCSAWTAGGTIGSLRSGWKARCTCWATSLGHRARRSMTLMAARPRDRARPCCRSSASSGTPPRDSRGSGQPSISYLGRIGVVATPSTDLPTLRAIHRAHVGAVPFENLHIQMGLPVRLDLASLQAKLIRQRRGGYCFEQNTLLLHALRAIGFEVTACEARVRPDDSRVLPRTHMVLVAALDDVRWLCDVGFGADGPLEPVAFGGSEQQQSHWRSRLVAEGAQQVLQLHRDGRWRDLYAFLPEPRYPVDFEVANWFTSTSPESRFVLTLTAQRSTPEARFVLRDLDLTVSRRDGAHARTVPREALIPLLHDTFLIDLPADTRFRSLDAPASQAG